MSEQTQPDTGRAGSAARAGFETRAIHAGQEPDPTTGAVVALIQVRTQYRVPACQRLHHSFRSRP
ncbi:MAG TPA: hypothetical protein VFD59_00525 [Nocardioidaceae bacterium]|nr:hypothetical protein [Nocardioidaceae bacterium]